jgi:acyl-CoA synthetase (NDP forming)
MLRARSIALVGASARAGTLGARMIGEVTRGQSDRRIDLVNPRYDHIDGRVCVPSLKHLDEPSDLALLAVPDDVLEAQLRDAAECGVRSAVIFGAAHGNEIRASLRAIARDAGMAVCGAGCMGFVNVEEDLRATGYLERPVIPAGPIGLITHSGSMFSALLRTHRALGFTLAVSSGQELVTTAADYVDFALDESATRVLALVLETVRDGTQLAAALRRATAAAVPVVVLPVGGSELGAELVTAHSGALAGAHGMWEALAEGTGALLVRDLAELTDTLECLALGLRARPARGLATVHDSGAERSLVADLAADLEVPFAPLQPQTERTLQSLLDDGLVATNPLDLWGRGADTRELFAASLLALIADPNVSLTALAVDLVEEYDDDRSYLDAVLDVNRAFPVAVLTNLASAIDQRAAAELRAAGIPVLEGTVSGLVALRHVLALAERVDRDDPLPPVDTNRRDRWLARLERPDPLVPDEGFALLADYGIRTVEGRTCCDENSAVDAARGIGYPVVLKTAAGLAHKSDVGGVTMGLGDERALRDAYRAMSAQLGPDVAVYEQAAGGVEIALGIVRDPQLGPLVVIAAGGLLAELLHDRAVAMPPLTVERAENLLRRLTIRPTLDGWRGSGSLDVEGLAAAVVAVGSLAAELGDRIGALDVNPVIVAAQGAVAVDVFVQH